MKFKCLLFVCVLVLLVAPTSAWLSGYNYRTGHYINGSDSGAQTYYQILLNVSNTSGTSSGDLLYTQGHNINFPEDLRFTDTSDTQWDYWVESNNTTYATIWIEVPSIPSGSTNQIEMYCYYGNSTVASASNGTLTFPLLFDHFDGTSINTTTWSITGTGASVSSSILSVTNGSSYTLVRSNSYFGDNTSLVSKLNTSHFGTIASSYITFGYWNSSGNSADANYVQPGVAATKYQTYNGGTCRDVIGGWSASTWHRQEISRSNQAIYNVDFSNTINHGATCYPYNLIRVYHEANGAGMAIYSDYVFVRKYVYPEPAHSTYTAEELAPCTADFTGTPLFGVAPLDVQFTDSSTTSWPPIVNWSWQFGDGGTSFLQNPLYTYAGIGTYWVNLTITNSLGSTSSLNRTAYISTEIPVANFTGTPTYGYVPLSVQFNDTTSNTPTSWNWSFGDGTYSNDQNASHIYIHSGLYNVSLNATNAVGSDIENKINYINVSVMPNVIFSGTPLSGATPLTVSFTDASTTTEGTIDTWDWMFGDGSPNSTTQNPTHAYTTSGIYSVSLTVSNSFGIYNSTTYTNYVNAGNASTPTPTPTPTQTPSNATGGTRGYSAEETAIPFWLWAVIIILGSALLIAGLFGRHLIFGIMSTMCFAAAAFASPMVSFFYQEVVLSNESEVAYSVFPMKWLVTQPWVAWLLWGMALLALLVVVYGVIVGMAEIKKPGDEFLEDDWLDKRDF